MWNIIIIIIIIYLSSIMETMVLWSYFLLLCASVAEQGQHTSFPWDWCLCLAWPTVDAKDNHLMCIFSAAVPSGHCLKCGGSRREALEATYTGRDQHRTVFEAISERKNKEEEEEEEEEEGNVEEERCLPCRPCLVYPAQITGWSSMLCVCWQGKWWPNWPLCPPA